MQFMFLGTQTIHFMADSIKNVWVSINRMSFLQFLTFHYPRRGRHLYVLENTDFLVLYHDFILLSVIFESLISHLKSAQGNANMICENGHICPRIVEYNNHSDWLLILMKWFVNGFLIGLQQPIYIVSVLPHSCSLPALGNTPVMFYYDIDIFLSTALYGYVYIIIPFRLCN